MTGLLIAASQRSHVRGGDAAVDEERRGVDVRGVVAGEKERRVGDLAGLGEASHRHVHEAPLRGTFRLTLLKKGSRAIPGGRGTLDMPFGENADFWMPVGLNADLDEAMKQAVRQAIIFLAGEHGMARAVAYAYMSAATDYVVSQVVDKTKGVHARIVKAHFVRR